MKPIYRIAFISAALFSTQPLRAGDLGPSESTPAGRTNSTMQGREGQTVPSNSPVAEPIPTGHIVPGVEGSVSGEKPLSAKECDLRIHQIQTKLKNRHLTASERADLQAKLTNLQMKKAVVPGGNAAPRGTSQDCATK